MMKTNELSKQNQVWGKDLVKNQSEFWYTSGTTGEYCKCEKTIPINMHYTRFPVSILNQLTKPPPFLPRGLFSQPTLTRAVNSTPKHNCLSLFLTSSYRQDHFALTFTECVFVFILYLQFYTTPSLMLTLAIYCESVNVDG